MKKVLFLTLVLLLISVSGLLFAHPPATVELDFDNQTMMLMVRVTHNSDNLESHYVQRVVVQLNDDEIINQMLLTQGSPEGAELVYKISGAPAGGTLRVTAHCSIRGQTTQTLQIPASSE